MLYNWLNVILGIWLIISAILSKVLSANANMLNVLIVGILVFIFALIPTFQKK
jgi:hypothetical protein